MQIRNLIARYNLVIYGTSRARLKELGEEKSTALIKLKEKFPQYQIRRIIVADPIILKKVDFENLPDEVVHNCLTHRLVSGGYTFDTRLLPREMAVYDKELRLAKRRAVRADVLPPAQVLVSPSPVTVPPSSAMGIEQAQTRPFSLPPAAPGFSLYRKLEQVTIFRSYRDFKIATIENPASWRLGDQAGLVAAFSWMGRPVDDMHAHVVDVSEIAIAFDRQGDAVAFATITDTPYLDTNWIGMGRQARIYSLVGTAVKAEYQGNRLEVQLNSTLLLGRLRTHIAKFGPFVPFLLGTITNGPFVIAPILRYFGDVKYNGFTPSEKAADRALMEMLGGECDDQGIIHNRYPELLPQAVQQPHFSKGLKKKVDAALSGIPSRHDARRFIFKLSVFSIVIKFYRDWFNRLFSSRRTIDAS
ncbi:MAG: hypothetical protein WC890_06160 [Candidatus Margulisiibacteriota bacterium]